MEEYIKKGLCESAELKLRVAQELAPVIQEATETIQSVLAAGGKIFLFGNGGSAAQAQHTATELVHQLKKDGTKRAAIPALVLGDNLTYVSAISNDWGFENVFARQLEALAQKHDAVIALTTSGSSINIIQGLRKAKEIGATTICLSGNGGGKINGSVDVHIIVPSTSPERIQEAHLTILHIICGLLEQWKMQSS